MSFAGWFLVLLVFGIFIFRLYTLQREQLDRIYQLLQGILSHLQSRNDAATAKLHDITNQVSEQGSTLNSALKNHANRNV